MRASSFYLSDMVLFSQTDLELSCLLLKEFCRAGLFFFTKVSSGRRGWPAHPRREPAGAVELRAKLSGAEAAEHARRLSYPLVANGRPEGMEDVARCLAGSRAAAANSKLGGVAVVALSLIFAVPGPSRRSEHRSRCGSAVGWSSLCSLGSGAVRSAA